MASFGERVVGAMKLNESTFEEIERDPSAMGQAVGVIVLAAVSGAIGNIYWGGVTGIVTSALFSVIGYIVWAAIVWLVGTKLMPDPATKADFPGAFRVIAFAAAPGVLGIATIVPILGYLIMFVLWLWSIAAMVVAVRAVLDFTSYGKAILVVVIGFCVNLLISGMLMAMTVGTAMLRRMT